MTRWIVMGIALALYGCGSDSGGDNNGSTTANNVATTNSAANSDSGLCAPGRFTETEVFTAENAYPFTFEIPAGNRGIDSSSDTQVFWGVTNVTSTGANGVFQTEILLTKEVATNPAIWPDIWAATHEPDTIAYDGAMVDAWTRTDGAQASTHLLFPAADGPHVMQIKWQVNTGCFDELEDLRILTSTTLKPNPDSVF